MNYLYISIFARTLVVILLFTFGISADEDTNSITVEVVLPDGDVAKVEELVEGEAATIVGMTHPFQYLNGGELLFPEGSLNENITLQIQVPDFATLSENAVSFGDNIASAVRFSVSVDDEPVSPYHFEIPLELTLPVPEQLPSGLGEDISTFVLAYKNTEGEFDTTGISTRVRDEVERLLTAEVEHFSDIVMTSENYIGDVTSVYNPEEALPSRYVLHQNYPNPFNPSTEIRFEVAELEHVTVDVYNLLGQKITTLVDSQKEPGVHTVTFDAGSLSSGLYIVTMRAGTFSSTITTLLMK